MSKSRGFLYVVLGVVLAVLTGATVVLLARYVDSQKPNYLSFTYSQNTKREPPIFHLKEPIKVESLFYNSSDEPIEFTALVFWTLVGNGQQILQFSFKQTLNPGCTELNFNNYPPDQVVQITKNMFTQGKTKVKWQIEGHNAVTSPYSGGLQPFRVEEATYVPDFQSLSKHKIIDKLSC